MEERVAIVRLKQNGKWSSEEVKDEDRPWGLAGNVWDHGRSCKRVGPINEDSVSFDSQIRNKLY